MHVDTKKITFLSGKCRFCISGAAESPNNDDEAKDVLGLRADFDTSKDEIEARIVAIPVYDGVR